MDTGEDTGVVVLKLARMLQWSQGLPPVSLYKITGALRLGQQPSRLGRALHQLLRRKA